MNSMQDKDDVTISVAVLGNNDCPPEYQAFGVGKFLVRDVASFRKEEQAKRFPFSDITATPLSPKEAHYLFGPLVAENYFVVKMALRNTTAHQRVLTTGMIRASGMALVEPAEGSAAESHAREQETPSPLGAEPNANADVPPKLYAKRFTLPITVSPLGLTQIYKIMDDTYPHQGRSVFFRFFDFFGTLASTAATTYTASVDLVKGLGLLTGAVRPGLDKAWHDSWPTFRSNVVEFGMQDLVKVGKNSEVSQKFIFFSKNTIQAQLQDPSFFGRFSDTKVGGLPLMGNDWYNAFIPSDEREQPELPKAAVVSLFFNQLDIPFETIEDAKEDATKPKT
ncbi:MAG: hypothetical protein H7837_14545 [Magnetococcus sp. MYC-9]